MYKAVIRLREKCPECDAAGCGSGERMDCGCLREEEVGDYVLLTVARLIAQKKARDRGAESWSVETDDGTVDFGDL